MKSDETPEEQKLRKTLIDWKKRRERSARFWRRPFIWGLSA